MNELNLRNGNKYMVLRQAGLKVSGRKKKKKSSLSKERGQATIPPKTSNRAIKQNHMPHRYASEMSGNCFSNILLKIPNRFVFFVF